MYKCESAVRAFYPRIQSEVHNWAGSGIVPAATVAAAADGQADNTNIYFSVV